MKLINRNILLISPEPWDHIFVSKHHYARYLAARGNMIVFANPPKQQWSLMESGITGIKVLDYPRFLRGLRLIPRIFSRWLILRKFQKIERYCKIDFDVVWSFDNSVFFDFSSLATLNISHIVDLNQNFELETAARTADICFYTTDAIGDKLKRINSNSFFINHGYNNKPIRGDITLPGSKNIKILYSGNMHMSYLDWDCLREAVLSIEMADFIFIGPFEIGAISEEIFNHERVHFLGKIHADELPGYYFAADILTICYQEAHHIDQSNPHKMMEYLGSGKCVISTYTQSFKQYQRPIIIMTERNKDFVKEIRLAIENIKELNSDALQNKRRAIAESNTYVRQIEKIEELISNYV